MPISPVVQLIVGITHRLRSAAPQHHLKINGLQTVVFVAMNHAGWTGNALPWPESLGNLSAIFVLNEDIEMSLKHEENLFNLMGVRRIALARLYIHNGQGKIAGWNRIHITMLARAPGTDESMLRALVSLDLGILECRPVGLSISKPRYVTI